MYGRTAVDLISVAGSLSDACQFLDLGYKRIGVSVRDKTEFKCFFSSEVEDGLVMIFFDASYKRLTTHR